MASVVSDSVRPHRRQPTRLPPPWDFSGKNTGVGCHFLLQCMKVKNESEVTQSCPTLSDPVDCSPPGSSIHGIFQARGLELGAIAFSECIVRGVYSKSLRVRNIWSENGSVVSDSLQPHGLYCLWNLQARILEWIAFPFSGGIFPTQGSNPGLPNCRWILYQLSHKGS